MNNRIKYFLKNWKVGVHLIFRTKRFGVNNNWWSNFDSIMGWPSGKKLKAILIIKPLINNYRGMKYRAGILHFMSDEGFKIAFRETKEEWEKKLLKSEK